MPGALPAASQPSASRIHAGNGTSTNCSAVCGTGRTRRRGGRERLEILGTSISCTGTKRSTIFRKSSNLSTICGTGTSTASNPGATSPNCSTVCRRTRTCCLTPARRSGRDPAAGTSSTSNEKYSVPAAWGVWDAPERDRVLLLVPTPRPLPSSVSAELSGAFSRQGSGRSTAAHAARQHAVVALSDAGKLL